MLRRSEAFVEVIVACRHNARKIITAPEAIDQGRQLGGVAPDEHIDAIAA